MSQPLRVLIIDDNDSDAILLERFLGRSAVAFVTERLQDTAKLVGALQRGWDAVLLDYMLPGTTAPEVLREIRRHNPTVPVIVLSGAVTEQHLVDVMKAGAQDYVLKSNMARLVPAL